MNLTSLNWPLLTVTHCVSSGKSLSLWGLVTLLWNEGASLGSLLHLTGSDVWGKPESTRPGSQVQMDKVRTGGSA